MHAGVTVLGEINPATDTVMNFFWLGGSFTFAVLLGVVTDDIVAFVEVGSVVLSIIGEPMQHPHCLVF